MRRILVRGYNEILKTAGELDGNFFFGLTTGAIILSVILYRFAGMAIGQPYSLDVAFSPMGQFHLVTIDLFFLFMPVSYYLLKDLDRGRRTIATLIMAIFMFSLHDVFWLVETFWVPQIYKDGLIITSIPFEEYIYHFSKNAINIIPCLAFLLKWRVFKPNYLAGLAFAGMILFHIYNIVFQVNIYVLNSSALLVMETIDAIPYLEKEERANVSEGFRVIQWVPLQAVEDARRETNPTYAQKLIALTLSAKTFWDQR